MTKILGLSGRSQAGKTHISNWLTGLWMQQANLIAYHYVDDDGDLVIPVELDGKVEDKVVRLNRETLWVKENVHPHVKQYNFADPLKKFCMNHFDCTYEQMYGTNEQKSTPTKIDWGNFPTEVRKKFGKKKGDLVTGRELLQAFGTEMVRKLYENAWVDGLIKQILEDAPHIAIVGDVRFPNEVEGLLNVGGMVVRLTRDPICSEHDSERALDSDNFDWTKFSAVIHNHDITRAEQNEIIYNILRQWEWIDFEISEWKSQKQLIQEAKQITKDSCRIK